MITVWAPGFRLQWTDPSIPCHCMYEGQFRLASSLIAWNGHRPVTNRPSCGSEARGWSDGRRATRAGVGERGWRGEETKTWRGSDRVMRKTKRKMTRQQRARACNRSYFSNRRKGFVNVRKGKKKKNQGHTRFLYFVRKWVNYFRKGLDFN